MPILVNDLATETVTRCGPALSAVGLDATTASPAILSALATAARDSGLCPASPFALTDADLSAADVSLASELADLSELRTLETVMNALMKPDQRASLGEKRWGQFRAEMEETLKRRAQYVEDRYGVGRGTIVGGVVGLEINEPAWPNWYV